MQLDDKMRIIQEIVPGKQITIAHVIANPDQSLYKKIGFGKECNVYKGAVGIITMCPGETSIIAADIALKAAGVELGYVDRINGTLIVTGTVSDAEAAVKAVVDYAKEYLGFAVCDITKT